MSEAGQNQQYKGRNGAIILTPTGVIIKRGMRGLLLGGGMLKGDKTIPYKSIVAVQLKKSGMVAGYIQFTLQGGSEAKGGVFEAAKDENTILFSGGKNNRLFTEAKEIIEERMAASHSTVAAVSSMDELEKLAGLKDKGIISNEEFEAKKKQLLSL